jgi:hypothetical protein
MALYSIKNLSTAGNGLNTKPIVEEDDKLPLSGWIWDNFPAVHKGLIQNPT